MRVLLLSTPYPLEENPLPPLSLAYLAGALRKEGFEVKILDYLVAGYNPSKLRRELELYRPKLVGATCVTLNYPIARRMLRLCKQFDPDIVTVIGGPHVTFALEETLLPSPWIDLVCIGEGERTIVDLARAVEGGKDVHLVSGVAFADGGKVVKTAPQSPVENLDDLPLPARELLPISRYLALNSPCTVITGRGCPYRCIFCSGRRMFGPKVRFRSPGLVVDEIEKIQRDFAFPQINIVDDTFTLNKRHATEVCEEMLRRNLKVKWSAFARADTITPDLAQLMRKAGCEWVLFGVESADENILRTIKKGITPADVELGVKIATEAGINVFNSFILGLPGETMDTALKSMAFAAEIHRRYGARYGFHILSPLPGTELYERPEQFSLRILTRNWSRYNANEPVTETPTMSPEMVKEVIGKYDRMIEEVWKDIRRRALSGDVSCMEQIEGKQRQEFIWTLFHGDVIEKLGRVSHQSFSSSEAEAELVRKISQKFNLDIESTGRRIRELITKGLLQLVSRGNALRWQWADSQELALRREATATT
jgi:anaerobic magnesium-protoporphyrin IX monomethyl ester cyclase